jgi:hypothetical protein
VLPIFIRQGWPPAMDHLSEMDGRPLCYPAFPLVVLLRKSYKDGVNSLSAAGSRSSTSPAGRYCTWPSYCDALPLRDQRAALP